MSPYDGRSKPWSISGKRFKSAGFVVAIVMDSPGRTARAACLARMTSASRPSADDVGTLVWPRDA